MAKPDERPDTDDTGAEALMRRARAKIEELRHAQPAPKELQDRMLREQGLDPEQESDE